MIQKVNTAYTAYDAKKPQTNPNILGRYRNNFTTADTVSLGKVVLAVQACHYTQYWAVAEQCKIALQITSAKGHQPVPFSQKLQAKYV